MNPNGNVYGYPSSTSTYVQPGNFERPGVTTSANVAMDYQQQQQPTQQPPVHPGWGYQQSMPQHPVNPIGQQMQAPVSANINQNQMQAPVQYANVPPGDKVWTGRSENTAVAGQKPQANFAARPAMGEGFGEDFDQTELFQGQPVLRQTNPPAQPVYQAKPHAPAAQQVAVHHNGNKLTNKDAEDSTPTVQTRYLNAPATNKPKPKVVEDDDEEEEEEEEDDNDMEDDISKDPWFEPEEEEEDDFVPDMSGSDEDFTIGRKRKPRKGRGGRRVTRSQSLNTKRGGTRSGRKKRRSQDDFIDDDDDDSDDDYAAVPIRRGQPALGKNDWSDDEYLPRGKRARVTPKKPAPKRGRMRSKSTPMTSKGGLKYEVYSDSPNDDDDDNDASDSEEEILLHRGQPVSNTRKSSKCSEANRKTAATLSEQSQIVFLVDRNMQERIKQLPEDCLYSDANYIWRLQNSILVKFKQRGDTNCFQATSNYLNYLPEMEKNYVPVSVEFLKDASTDVVRLFDVPEISGSGTPQSGNNTASYVESPVPKKRRGRPPKAEKAKAVKSPSNPGTKQKRGRPKKSKPEPEIVNVPTTEATAATEKTENQTDPKRDTDNTLNDLDFLKVVVKDYCQSMIKSNKQELESKTDAIVQFEQKVSNLKSQLLESFPLSPEFKTSLENEGPPTVEQCTGGHNCQAMASGSAAEATKVFCFRVLDAEKRFFVGDAAAQRCSLWSDLHHFPRQPEARDVVRDIIDCVVQRAGGGETSVEAGLPPIEDKYLHEIADLIRRAGELIKPTVEVRQ